MANQDTQIRCRACAAVIKRTDAYCSQCGMKLSPSQLRASRLTAMRPGELRELIEARMVEFGKLPVPLSSEALRLDQEARAIMYELKMADPEMGVERALLDRILGWSANATGELQKRKP